MWVRAENILIGHEPTFEITCRNCDEPMALRYTAVVMEKMIMRSGNEPANELAYKCPNCDLVERFIVPDKTDYMLSMLKARHGVDLYYPPVTVWASASDKIRRKLESLGYF